MSRVIYPTFLFLFVRVGLIPHSTYHAGDVARRGVPDQMSDGSTRVDRVRLRSTGRSIARALIQWIITAAIDWRGSHLSVGSRSKERKSSVFITLMREIILALHPRSDDQDLFENGPSWTVYRNRRSFRSDGYA